MKTWSERIRELQAAGFTLAAIGEAVGLATSSVGDLAVGRNLEPKGDAALKLHELHAKLPKKRRKSSGIGA